MNIDAFARQISSYIDFNTIRSTLISYDKNKDDILERATLTLGSEFLKNAADWDLYALISDYLKAFRIPEETIDLLVKIDGENKYSKEAINWLKNYKFSGNVIGNPDVSHLNVPFKPLIVITTASGIIDILGCPINFLFSTVENLSTTWRDAEKIGAHVFLEPNSPSEFFVYLEQRVSSHYKNIETKNPGESAGNSIFNGYRYVCLTQELNIDINLLNVAEKVAIEQANGTLR